MHETSETERKKIKSEHFQYENDFTTKYFRLSDRYFSVFLLQRPPVSFYIENLEPGSSYRIILFAVNAKGRSEPTIIDDITFKGVAKYTGELL